MLLTISCNFQICKHIQYDQITTPLFVFFILSIKQNTKYYIFKKVKLLKYWRKLTLSKISIEFKNFITLKEIKKFNRYKNHHIQHKYYPIIIMENLSVRDFLGWVLQRDLVRLGFQGGFFEVCIFLGFLIVFAFRVDFFLMIFFSMMHLC